MMQGLRAWGAIAALAVLAWCGAPNASAQQAPLIKADVAGSTTWWGQIPLMVASTRVTSRMPGWT